MGMREGGTSLDVIPSKGCMQKKRTTDGPRKALSRSCDACFVLKERCIRVEASKDCERCTRLSKACVSNRPVKPAGRRRLLPPPRSRNALTTTPDTKVSKLPYSLHPFGVLFKDLKPLEEFMIREFINPSNFTQLMIMPRIGKTMHQEAVQVFLRHYEDLEDGCFSMYGAMASALDLSYPGYDGKANLQRATAALKRFCAMPCPQTKDDFGRWLWLGLAVSIYAHCELGSPSSPVRRTILTHLVALGEKGREMRRHPLVVSFTTLDILECLFYRQRPVADLDSVCIELGLESFPGLTMPLIRFLYRLCVINCVDPARDCEQYDWLALDELANEVEAWQPTVSNMDAGELNRLGAVGMSQLLTRTRVHKTAILLYIHRIRHPFGEEDGTASTMATSIFSDLDLATATTSKVPDWVTTPFMLAGIETEGFQQRQKVEADLAKYVDSISPKARAMALEFLRALWAARDSGLGDSGLRWMDVMDHLPPLCVYI